MSDFIRHYGIFWTDPDHGRAMWQRATSKRVAVRRARQVNGYVITVGHGRNMAWDAPTFKVCGDVVADYRGTK